MDLLRYLEILRGERRSARIGEFELPICFTHPHGSPINFPAKFVKVPRASSERYLLSRVRAQPEEEEDLWIWRILITLLWRIYFLNMPPSSPPSDTERALFLGQWSELKLSFFSRHGIRRGAMTSVFSKGAFLIELSGSTSRTKTGPNLITLFGIVCRRVSCGRGWEQVKFHVFFMVLVKHEFALGGIIIIIGENLARAKRLMALTLLRMICGCLIDGRSASSSFFLL